MIKILTIYRIVECNALEEDQEKNEIRECGHKIDQSTGVTNIQAQERKQNGPGNDQGEQYGPIDFR